MRILILGGDGMLGHKVFQRLHTRLETYVTFRDTDGPWAQYPLYAKTDRTYTFGGIDALDIGGLQKLMKQVKPAGVINCVGIVKQRDEAKAAIPSIQVNALFPHQLADLCSQTGAKLIHLSTDCVFSGFKGNYSESDLSDPVDLYGRTKLLGELNRPGCLTLRTSIIGWELKNHASLLEWFATQRGRTIKGYCHAIYTGLATTTLADLIGYLLETRQDLSGLYQVASRPITKYDLLQRLRDTLKWKDIVIEPDEDFRCDRSLNGTHFSEATGWRAPEWDMMIETLASEWPTYDQWRKTIL
jgi:dTDP-4-dehydrorhamnose reductase